ncbi:hypothetical protein [Amycolatopsis thermophila]|uniref:Uncharacterized protein n=1 Tax=Amycolatopsis thermophila TaxID=206084 RepID=A0ABU0EYS6_9PSEU|nr:hypothetical protein [Amycolatopsis thermophila]MDQ0380461.1 hypothetical protein [Amycolatopsis thermophila]
MTHAPQDHIAHAVDALSAVFAHPDRAYGDCDALIALSDLSAIAALAGQLVGDYEGGLRRRAAVAPHLHQARQHALALSRALNVACGVLGWHETLEAAA